MREDVVSLVPRHLEKNPKRGTHNRGRARSHAYSTHSSPFISLEIVVCVFQKKMKGRNISVG